MTKHPAPPPFGEMILRYLLPSQIREPLLGDLAEQHAARCREKSYSAANRWYWNEVVAAAAHAVLMRIRNAITVGDVEEEAVVGTTSRQIVRVTLVLFLPTLFAVILLISAAESFARHGSILKGVQGAYLPLVIGGPVLMAAGYGLVLILFRHHVQHNTLERTRLHVTAAALAVVALGLLSIFTQGAHLPFILVAHLGAGAGSALVITSRSLWRDLRAS